LPTKETTLTLVVKSSSLIYGWEIDTLAVSGMKQAEETVEEGVQFAEFGLLLCPERLWMHSHA
jgi:hypothetical protein